jgi:hypothetical protein
MFIVCLNLATGLIIALQLPAVGWVNPTVPTVNTTDYESQFNATEIAKGWQANPLQDFLGDVFSMFNFLWVTISYMLDGFPQMLFWMRDSYLTDISGITAFDILANALRALYAIMFAWFVIDFISGRETSG